MIPFTLSLSKGSSDLTDGTFLSLALDGVNEDAFIMTLNVS